MGKILSLSGEYFVSIDHVPITYRVKRDSEIKNDASLVAYYKFVGGSTLDSGQNL
jgi:hypothetical protein